MNAKRLAELQASYPAAFVSGNERWLTYRRMRLRLLRRDMAKFWSRQEVMLNQRLWLLSDGDTRETLMTLGDVLRIEGILGVSVCGVVASLCDIKEANGVIEWGIQTREPTWSELANDDLSEILSMARK